MSYPQQPPVPPQQAYPTPAYTPPPQAYAPPPQGYPAPPQQGYPTPTYAPPPQASYAPPPQQFAGVQGQPGQVAVVACRFCGCVPAAATKFRGHQGFIVMMRFLSLDGPFCRDCGLSTFRSMTSKTLVQGWYGYASLVITPITVLMNIARRGKVANLPAPQANPWGPSRQPMDPGPHLLARPMTLIGLGIPFALIILLVVAISLSGS